MMVSDGMWPCVGAGPSLRTGGDGDWNYCVSLLVLKNEIQVKGLNR